MIRGVACPLAFLVVAGTLASAPLSAQTSPPALEPAPAGTRATTASADPRVGLEAGLADAGVAARNLELLANVPKPAGFFDPSAPAGQPNP
ncbi:MAG: hypothetical protein ACR2LU_02195, partial [Luteitalea sp.]